MTFYRKRQVIIDADEWDGSEERTLLIVGKAFHYNTNIRYVPGGWQYVGLHDTPNGPSTEKWVPEHLEIDTLEGTMTAQVGDFIIRGVEDEHYPCKPDIFWKTYEAL
jgi:hypothetical protein